MFFIGGMFAASVKLRVVSSNGGTIHKGETFHIVYSIQGGTEIPSNPHVPGAKLLYFDMTGGSANISQVNINGHITSSGSINGEYTATLRATEEGKFTFGPVVIGGVKSNAVTYTIGKETNNSVRQAQQQAYMDPDASSTGPKFIGTGNGNLFLRASVSKTNAYEKEALVYTVKLYCTFSAIRFIGATAAPKFEGFVVEESPNTDKSLHFETYNGKNYATAVIARYIIFPQMQGTLKVLGNTYTVAADERQYYNDPLFGSLSTSAPVQLNVKPNDLTVTVKPLPQPQPADFSGGVGQFVITSNLPNQKFLTNQAASIVYTVKGSGNLKYVKIPDLNNVFPKELEVYSPETNVSANVGVSNVSGDVKFDYSFMPLEEGEFKIPDITLVYFNPSTGQYEKSVAKGYTITVGKGQASAKSQTRLGMRFDDKLLPVLPNLNHSHVPYVNTFLYWLWYIIPVILFIAAMTGYRKHLNDMADIKSLKSRKANKMALRRLRKAAACMKAGDSDMFYDEILHAIWGYLGDKLKMPVSDLNRENIADKLGVVAGDSKSIWDVIDLLDECEFAKFSPVQQSKNMPIIYQKASETIANLEDSINAKKITEGAVESAATDLKAGNNKINDRYVNDDRISTSLSQGNDDTYEQTNIDTENLNKYNSENPDDMKGGDK
ncbi:MAG: BatD family protein [Prevotella sp.]|nr:BatD family protein [Prevotella sp.]MCM1436988.1 BatD family protein [Prevotella sp.]